MSRLRARRSRRTSGSSPKAPGGRADPPPTAAYARRPPLRDDGDLALGGALDQEGHAELERWIGDVASFSGPAGVSVAAWRGPATGSQPPGAGMAHRRTGSRREVPAPSGDRARAARRLTTASAECGPVRTEGLRGAGCRPARARSPDGRGLHGATLFGDAPSRLLAAGFLLPARRRRRPIRLRVRKTTRRRRSISPASACPS